ncbi:MAG: cyclic nucleotide-binding domain-containing protein, partial [Spongiibacteraceae bacterium]|nr:cyclic nucleotide-binding domain-containing protein [Spongiibacteraceae bacterium]
MVTHHDNLKKQLLQTFVPLCALTEAHLDALFRDTSVEVLCRGQTLFEVGEYDHHYVYLLSGALEIGTGPLRRIVQAADPVAAFPVAHQQPRLEPARALEDCELLRIDCDVLDAMVAWDQASHYILLDIASQRDLDEDAEWMQRLLRSDLFYKVPPMNIRRVIDRFTPQFRYGGDVVIRQGEIGDSCYFVKEGAVQVFRSTDGRSRGERIAVLGPGRSFGQDALVDDAPRNATVVMAENGVLMRLEKQDFYLLLKSPPARTLSLVEADRELRAGAGLIDVRTELEFEQAHAAGALNMPLNILKLKSRLLDRDRTYII